MKRLVSRKVQLGLLGYLGRTPVGWCAVAPREDFTRLAGSRVLRPVDEQPVWSIPCFFIAREHRRRGLSSELLKGVIAYARRKGAKILEGYPIIPYSEAMPAPFAWTGMLSSFTKAGFHVVMRRSRARPIVRFVIRPQRG